MYIDIHSTRTDILNTSYLHLCTRSEHELPEIATLAYLVSIAHHDGAKNQPHFYTLAMHQKGIALIYPFKMRVYIK